MIERSGIELYNVVEVAELLRVGRMTIYPLVRNGTIKAIKVGGQWRIKKESIEEYLNGQQS